MLLSTYKPLHLQGHIVRGLKDRLKDFRRTPKTMIRIPSKACITPLLNDSDDTNGEDSVSHERHKKILQQEFKKGKPNLQVLFGLISTYIPTHYTF